MAGFADVLKHGGNYLIANFATRALAFISIPVYTHLLTTEDYGIYSIFIGIVAIANNILTLCTDQAVGRYYFDRKSDEDFKRFVGTSSVMALCFFIFNSVILFIFAPQIAELVDLDTNLIYLMIPLVLMNITGLTFEQIYQVQKKSKQIAISSLSRVYLGFACSIGLILLFTSDKYYGQILGQILAGIVMLFYWVRKIRPYFTLSFDKKYLKYIFTFSVPLIPYVLSYIIIEQFGKIALGSTHDVSEAGFYALALTIASITSIVTQVTHQAWSPYYFEYMNSKNYGQHDKDLNRIFRITLVAGFFVSVFGQEIGILLAKRDFTSSLYLVPILVFGYIFHQLSYAYIRNVSFVRKTVYMSVIVVASGIVNIVLNAVVIGPLGELGVAISFATSYMFMGFLSWAINKWILKVHGISLPLLLKPLAIYGLFIVLLYLLYFIDSYWATLGIKIVLICSFIAIILWGDRVYIINTIKRFLKR